MKIRKFGPFRMVGAYVLTSHEIEASESTALISELEMRFFDQWLGGLIPYRLDRCEWMEVYTEYESDHLGEFTFIKGHRVWQIEDVPEGMMAIEVPRRRYAVFTVDPDKDFGFSDTEEEILRYFSETPKYERAYLTDFILSGGRRTRFYISIK